MVTKIEKQDGDSFGVIVNNESIDFVALPDNGGMIIEISNLGDAPSAFFLNGDQLKEFRAWVKKL